MKHAPDCAYNPGDMTMDPTSDRCTCGAEASALLNAKVQELMTGGACSRAQALAALYVREDNVELAAEFINRKNLAAVMPDRERYPKWHALLDERARERAQFRNFVEGSAYAFILVVTTSVIMHIINIVARWLNP